MVARHWAARVRGLLRHERMIADSADHRLLTIAEEHVRRFGVDRLTVVAVAREAGMTHANVYRYFPSKSALADAVSAQWLRALDALLTDAAGSPDPADDKLERMMVALAAALRKPFLKGGMWPAVIVRVCVFWLNGWWKRGLAPALFL